METAATTSEEQSSAVNRSMRIMSMLIGFETDSPDSVSYYVICRSRYVTASQPNNEYRKKHTKVTHRPKIPTFPMFSKNFLRRMLKPELRMIGGSKKSKNRSCLN